MSCSMLLIFVDHPAMPGAWRPVGCKLAESLHAAQLAIGERPGLVQNLCWEVTHAKSNSNNLENYIFQDWLNLFPWNLKQHVVTIHGPWQALQRLPSSSTEASGLPREWVKVVFSCMRPLLKIRGLNV